MIPVWRNMDKYRLYYFKIQANVKYRMVCVPQGPALAGNNSIDKKVSVRRMCGIQYMVISAVQKEITKWMDGWVGHMAMESSS